ncbi:ankyrin repeat-containing protein BDA1-like [Salvia miltiorrhiza]|uniref:ankyrin repeat-containing protein BDA1-like n=1 Tax=Salvia miltiorrhiza TaxID=226208 RepID=UPI0025ABC0D9|nr:ankyrin repeat-containing protein BDA1-like [Salvia miltiorrhiza]
MVRVPCFASSRPCACAKTKKLMSECHCEMAELTAPVKICECDCDCDCRCCIDQLYSTIAREPKWLQDMDKIQFFQTPLHEAAAAGNTTLTMEIMNLMPSLGKKLNPEGLSPLHVAVDKESFDTALALAKLDKALVRVKGKGGLTPLHFAAVAKPTYKEDELKLLVGLLAECPDAVLVLNNRGQSAVHLALENRNVKAAKLLVNWVVIVAKESHLSFKDASGNTTLHVAARYCDDKDLLKSLTNLVKVNKENKYGETALDVAIHHRNHAAVDILKNAGGFTTRDHGEDTPTPRESKASTMVRYLRGHHAEQRPEMLTRAYYFITKELTLEMRNTILVVAVLIATATYQGVLQPPGGVYSAEGSPSVRLGGRRLVDASGQKHPPGRMVMGTVKYSYFMPTNTLAFMSSTLIIIFVLPDRAFVMILQACLIFMCVSYLLALNFISYYNSFSKILDFVCGCTLGVAFLMKLGYYFVKAYYNEDEWLLRRLGVKIKNHKAWFFRDTYKKPADDEEMSTFRRMRQQYKLISKRLG